MLIRTPSKQVIYFEMLSLDIKNQAPSRQQLTTWITCLHVASQTSSKALERASKTLDIHYYLSLLGGGLRRFPTQPQTLIS